MATGKHVKVQHHFLFPIAIFLIGVIFIVEAVATMLLFNEITPLMNASTTTVVFTYAVIKLIAGMIAFIYGTLKSTNHI
jgi:hypothetical protein